MRPFNLAGRYNAVRARRLAWGGNAWHIVEFGIAFSQLNVYTGAAREGARYAAVRCEPDSTTGCTSVTSIIDEVEVIKYVGRPRP